MIAVKNSPVLGSSMGEPKIVICCHHLPIFRSETIHTRLGEKREIKDRRLSLIEKNMADKIHRQTRRNDNKAETELAKWMRSISCQHFEFLYFVDRKMKLQ